MKRLIWVLFLMAFFYMPYQPATACVRVCPPLDNFPKKLELQCENAGAVFLGEVTQIRQIDSLSFSAGLGPRIIVTFKVQSYWKGEVGTEIDMHTFDAGGIACDGLTFLLGKTYLVVAEKKGCGNLAKWGADCWSA